MLGYLGLGGLPPRGLGGCTLARIGGIELRFVLRVLISSDIRNCIAVASWPYVLASLVSWVVSLDVPVRGCRTVRRW
jgi:hypothetical protein